MKTCRLTRLAISFLAQQYITRVLYCAAASKTIILCHCSGRLAGRFSGVFICSCFIVFGSMLSGLQNKWIYKQKTVKILLLDTNAYVSLKNNTPINYSFQFHNAYSEWPMASQCSRELVKIQSIRFLLLSIIKSTERQLKKLAFLEKKGCLERLHQNMEMHQFCYLSPMQQQECRTQMTPQHKVAGQETLIGG